MIPVFLAITADATAAERRRAAWRAVVVAAVVIATFALFGQQILVHLGGSRCPASRSPGAAVAVPALSLRCAGLLQRILHQAGIDLITRISGLLLSAIAVELAVDAVREFARAGL